MTSRPDDLPDFQAPPLNEVVLGIQFATPRGYQQIYACEVWGLYRDQFPLVEEHPPITPAFETFGLPQASQVKLGFVTGASHDRFWFVSREKQQLIQFQNDRLLHNWRKVDDETGQYPRFESIIRDFEREILLLQDYFLKFNSSSLNITQCEISYINHINVGGEASTRIADWLRFVNVSRYEPDDFSAAFRKTINDLNGKPQGRLICEVATAVNAKAEPMLALTLTARGAPASPNVQSALDFLGRGRAMVVNLFAEVTTDSAHQRWERLR